MRARRRTTSALLLLAAGEALAADRIVGQTFPIAEPDTLAEIKERAAARDWHSWMQQRKPESYSAFISAELPKAKKDDSRLFNPTYAIPRDITDASGKVLYPAGTKVNVYDKLTMRGRYIVIAPTPADYKWLDDVAKPTAADKVLLASGNVAEARSTSKKELWLLDARFIERFGLQATPAIVSQEGNQLRVREYAVD